MAFNSSSCDYQEGVKVWYDGCKTFWRAHTTVDIVIAYHINYSTIEIVCFNQTLGVKAPRIYVSMSSLKAKIDQYEFNSRLKIRKEYSLRHKTRYNLRDETIKIIEDLCLEYIFQRLDVAPGSTLENFQMELHAQAGDHKVILNGQSVIAIQCECPQLLIPVTVHHKKLASSEEMVNVIKALKDENLELVHATHQADLLASSIEGFKSKTFASGLNKSRYYWKKAIRKILIINYVDKVKERLRRSHIKKWFERMERLQQIEPRSPSKKVILAEYAHDTTNSSQHKAHVAMKAIGIASKLSKHSVGKSSARDDSHLPHISKTKLNTMKESHDIEKENEYSKLRAWTAVLNKSKSTDIDNNNHKQSPEAHIKHINHGTIFVSHQGNVSSHLPPIGAELQDHHHDHIKIHTFAERSRLWKRHKSSIAGVLNERYGKKSGLNDQFFHNSTHYHRDIDKAVTLLDHKDDPYENHTVPSTTKDNHQDIDNNFVEKVPNVKHFGLSGKESKKYEQSQCTGSEEVIENDDANTSTTIEDIEKRWQQMEDKAIESAHNNKIEEQKHHHYGIIPDWRQKLSSQSLDTKPHEYILSPKIPSQNITGINKVESTDITKSLSTEEDIKVPSLVNSYQNSASQLDQFVSLEKFTNGIRLSPHNNTHNNKEIRKHLPNPLLVSNSVSKLDI